MTAIYGQKKLLEISCFYVDSDRVASSCNAC